MSPDDPRHGTYAGASAHRKDHEKPCTSCGLVERRVRKRNRYRAALGQPASVPALGAVRRIRALRRLGWTVVDIARESGVPEKTLRNPCHRGATVYRTTAEAVATTYERLAMVVPQGGYHTRERNYAERKGWPPPLAWDDIDDPTEQPKGRGTGPRQLDVDEAVVARILAGEKLPANRAEREAVVARWPGTLAELARRTGWKVERYTRRDVA